MLNHNIKNWKCHAPISLTGWDEIQGNKHPSQAHYCLNRRHDTEGGSETARRTPLEPPHPPVQWVQGVSWK